MREHGTRCVDLFLLLVIQGFLFSGGGEGGRAITECLTLLFQRKIKHKEVSSDLNSVTGVWFFACFGFRRKASLSTADLA